MSELIVNLSPVLAGLLVFFARVTDMSLDTLRMLFVLRGKKFLAAAIGSFQALVFIIAISAVLTGPLNFWTILGYSLGFGTGIYVGMIFEGKLAIGFSRIQAYSKDKGEEIALALHESGHAATTSVAQGMKGPVTMINCIVSRKNIPEVERLIEATDNEVFITIDEISPMRGYFQTPSSRKFLTKQTVFSADLRKKD